MSNDISRIRGAGVGNLEHTKNKSSSDGTFSRTMKSVADGALAAVGTAASVIPGGALVSAATNGLRAALGGGDVGANDQMDKMWAMQRESQMFNLQYLELQTAIQEDNRRFSTMSNLMKARHDTAKAAINNMHV